MRLEQNKLWQIIKLVNYKYTTDDMVQRLMLKLRIYFFNPSNLDDNAFPRWLNTM